jgi:hypothetical protein
MVVVLRLFAIVLILMLCNSTYGQDENSKGIRLEMDTLANLLIVSSSNNVIANVYELNFNFDEIVERIGSTADGRLVQRVLKMQQSPKCRLKELHAITKTNAEIREVTLNYIEELMIRKYGKRRTKKMLK